MSRKTLVTGATGFIGGALVRRLLAEGHEVHAPLRPSARRWRLEDLRNPRLQLYQADLLDRSAVAEVVQTVAPEVVIHLATHGAYEAQSDPQAIIATNALGTQNLLDASVAAGVSLFINTGSSSEYGFKAAPMKESDLPEPNSHYAVAKLAQTHLCRLTSVTQDLPLVTFRLFSVYGPWEEPSRLIPNVLRRARAGLPLKMADRKIARDFVYVEDVLDALSRFDRLQSLRGEILNLGSGVERTLEEVVEAVRGLVGPDLVVEWGGMQDRKWDTHRWVADPSKTEQTIGWRAQHDFVDGLAKMSAWMLERNDQYGPL